MKRIGILLVSILLSGLYIESAIYKPKIGVMYENGSRYRPLENDYSSIDFKADSHYDFSIKGFRFKQKISETSFLSITFKQNNKDYNPVEDNLDNRSNKVFGFLRWQMFNPLTIKINAVYRNKKYYNDLTKNNDWLGGGITLKFQPQTEKTKLFLDSKQNIYTFDVDLSKFSYPDANEKNNDNVNMMLQWKSELTDKLKLNTKGKMTIRRYSAIDAVNKKNSIKHSVSVEMDYQF